MVPHSPAEKEGCAWQTRAWLAGALGLLLVLAAVGMVFHRYSNDLTLMLPADANVRRVLGFLNESSLSHDIVVSLALVDEQRTTADLIGSVDTLCDSIKSPLFTSVTGAMGSEDALSEMMAFSRYTPQLLGPEEFAALTNRLTPEGVRDQLQRVHRMCLAPVSSFTVPFLRVDPLGMSGNLLRDMAQTLTSLGYDVTLTDGHLLSRDGRHALVILRTPVNVTDSQGARAAVGYLRARLEGLPSGVKGSIIAGHMHTVGNEVTVKHDILVTSLVATLAFLALFLISFHDLRATLVFVMPMGAVLLATNVADLFFHPLSAMVVGLSSVVAGISIDYGIYVYVATRHAGNSRETLRQIVKPVVFGALTTISVFATFFLSHTEGYRQLALISTLSFLFCLFCALFVLPRFLGPGATAPLSFKPAGGARQTSWRDGLCVAIWALVTLALTVSSTRLTLNNDATQMDGSGAEVLAADEAFHATWGGRTVPAVLVVPAHTQEEARERNDAVSARLVQSLGRSTVSSLATVWPSKVRRAENQHRWETFWSPVRRAELQAHLAQSGQAYGFATNAFDPFFARLQDPPGLDDTPQGVAFFARLQERFLTPTRDGYAALSFFPDTDDNLVRVAGATADSPGVFVVSRRQFGRMIASVSLGELAWLSLAGLAATVLLTILLLRQFRLTLLALLPVVTCVAAILGTAPLLHVSLNIPAMIAALMAISLVSDYGLFAAYDCQYGYRTGTSTAVALAAASTLIGAGALLFARHPTLFSFGFTLVVGVSAGFLTSRFVVPALHNVWRKARGRPQR